jgi:DNA-binding response OmpR family regulator
MSDEIEPAHASGNPADVMSGKWERNVVRALVVHEQSAIRARVCALLAGEGFIVEEAAAWNVASHHLASYAPGLLLTTPFVDRVDVLSLLVHRDRPASAAVIVLVPDGLSHLGPSSLDRGADDFIAESSISRDLLSHVRAVLRRSAPDRARTLVFGELEIDLRARAVRLRGKPIELTRREYELLELLARRPGEVYTHREILEEVWGRSTGEHHHATVHEHIRRVRNKLAEQDSDVGSRLHSLRGVGYVFRP